RSERTNAKLDGELRMVLAAVNRVETHGFAGIETSGNLLHPLARQFRIKLHRIHADELAPRVAEAFASLLVNIPHDSVLVVQKKPIRSVVHESPKTRFALAQLLLGSLAVFNILGQLLIGNFQLSDTESHAILQLFVRIL